MVRVVVRLACLRVGRLWVRVSVSVIREVRHVSWLSCRWNGIASDARLANWWQYVSGATMNQDWIFVWAQGVWADIGVRWRLRHILLAGIIILGNRAQWRKHCA